MFRYARMAGPLLLFLLIAGTLRAQAVTKPFGVFAASGATNPAVQTHPEVRGVLVRAGWQELEPQPGVFDFNRIENQVESLRQAGLHWSLAVSGSDHPDWLRTQFGADSFTILFRGEPKIIPKAWDPVVRQRLAILAEALGDTYANDPLLSLVYVPQMSANGIEGHFNGVTAEELAAAGYTEDNWVESVKIAARDFALAFPSHAVAVEVHEIVGSATPAQRILDDLWHDASLGHRVGGAMWWLSGKTDYQPTLLQFLDDFEGDLYCQVIASSDQPGRLLNDDLGTAFDQAVTLGARYVEAWEYEFESGTHDDVLAGFNQYALVFAGTTDLPPVDTLVDIHLACYPNPFNPRLKIVVTLPGAHESTIDIYDMTGRHVARVFKGFLESGEHIFQWDGRDFQGRPLASGVYRIAARGPRSAGNTRAVLVR